MEDILYWVIFFGILTFGMKFYSKWSNTKTSKKDLLSEKEVEARSNEKFPFWYHIYFPVLIFVMVGVALGLVLLSWYFLTHFPQWLLVDKSYIALSTNPWGMYLMLLVFFPGIILGAFVMSPLIRIFPGIVRYVEKNQIKNWGIRVKANAEVANRPFIVAALISSAVIFPLIFLAADNYYYVDEQALHYNSFWSLTEDSIPLSNLEKIEVGAWPNNGRNASGINWEYILVFNTGERFNMKEADISDLKELDTFLMTKNTPVEITTLRDGAMEWVNDSAPQDLKDLFAQAFSRALKPVQTPGSQ